MYDLTAIILPRHCRFSTTVWNYTKTLRAIWNKSWKQHSTKPKLYDHLQLIHKRRFPIDYTWIPQCWMTSKKFSRVSTTICLQHLDSNKTPEENVRWELHKDTAWCFQQILKIETFETATVSPLTSHPINHPRETPKHGNTRVGRSAKT